MVIKFIKGGIITLLVLAIMVLIIAWPFFVFGNGYFEPKSLSVFFLTVYYVFIIGGVIFCLLADGAHQETKKLRKFKCVPSHRVHKKKEV